MSIIDQLKTLGLNSSECTVYLFVLQHGSCTPPDVSQGTGIARTNCYNLLDTLLEKKLIEERPDGKRKAYVARHPSAVVEMLKEQQAKAEQLLPDLEALYAPQQFKPAISYYSGWDEIRSLFYQALDETSITLHGSLAAIEPFTGMLVSFFKEEVTKRHISFNYSDKQLNVSQETVNKANTQTLVLQWGTNIAFIIAAEQPFATVLANKTISEALYTLFS